MKLKIFTEEEVLFDGEYDVTQSAELSPIRKYDDRETKAITFEFKKGHTVLDTSRLDEWAGHPSWFEGLQIKIK